MYTVRLTHALVAYLYILAGKCHATPRPECNKLGSGAELQTAEAEAEGDRTLHTPRLHTPAR